MPLVESLTVRASRLCSHFSLSRVAAGSVDRAVDRAARCAAAFETECVLAPEIGLGIPAAFVYDEEAASMRMLIAPRGSAHDGVPTELLVQDPAQDVGALARAFNRTIRAEYLPGGKRAPRHGGARQRLQLVRAASAPGDGGRVLGAVGLRVAIPL